MKAFALSSLGRDFMAQSSCFLLDTTPGMLPASSASVHLDFQVSADSHPHFNFLITVYLSVILFKNRIEINCLFLFRREGCVSTTHISISGHFFIYTKLLIFFFCGHVLVIQFSLHAFSTPCYRKIVTFALIPISTCFNKGQKSRTVRNKYGHPRGSWFCTNQISKGQSSQRINEA